MIRYKDLPKMTPPCESTVEAIETVQTWLSNPVNNQEPDQATVDVLAALDNNAEGITEEIQGAYKERVYTEGLKEDSTVTEEQYFKRLRQINDTAVLIAAASIANSSREKLMGFEK